MILQIDKYATFGIHKMCGNYVQFQQVLSVSGKVLPAIAIDHQFSYLDKLLNFGMRDANIKEQLEQCLTDGSTLHQAFKITRKTKMHILKQYRPTLFTFEQCIYDISLTWTQHLDAVITNSLWRWLANH